MLAQIKIKDYQVDFGMKGYKYTRVRLYDDAEHYRGFIQFVEGKSEQDWSYDPKGTFEGEMAMHMLSPVIDILRNEEPVTLTIFHPHWACLHTGLEPVGEGEKMMKK